MFKRGGESITRTIRSSSTKRGQMTAFIILGLLLVLVVSIVLYLQYNIGSSQPAALVPPEIKPIYDVIDGCVKEASEQAIRRLGAQGGYLQLPPVIDHVPTSYVTVDDVGFMKVPFWYYDGEDRTPPLSLMETQLAADILLRASECIDNFSAVGDRITMLEKGQMKVGVTIAKENVVVRTTWPLRWNEAGAERKADEYISIVDVRLGEMYGLADKVLLSENRGAFFENITIDLMTMDPSIPFDGLEVGCTPKRWSLPTIRDQVAETLRVNLPAVRIRNTNHLPFARPQAEYDAVGRYGIQDIMAGRIPKNVPPDVYEYFQLYMDANAERTTLRSGFSYQPAWGMALTASPNDGGTLASKVVKGGGGYLDMLCINSYHFTYDVIYPVMFTVRDDKAFAGNGATFRMTFPVIIRRNGPGRETFGISSFRGFGVEAGFCDSYGDTVVDLRAKGAEEGAMLGSDLDGVNFTLNCLGRECPLGTSEANGGFYRLLTKLPEACINPTIVASKAGWLTNKGQLTGDTLSIPLKRLRDVRVSVVKNPVDLPAAATAASAATVQALTVGSEITLSRVENVSIRLSVPGTDYDRFMLYPSTDTIEMVDGTQTYDVELLLSQHGSLTGGFVQKGVTIDSGNGVITFHVMEGRPLGFDDAYRGRLAVTLYGTGYQAQLAPEVG
jgi:hypothetical protein